MFTFVIAEIAIQPLNVVIECTLKYSLEAIVIILTAVKVLSTHNYDDAVVFLCGLIDSVMSLPFR